ncbi:MAG TPA: nitroreductase/quinone reductase family protein [Xanthobacteraceae bacterium]|nr:nitroreductase/quinone reductase family protein [Xanthobacteraceae bacterium]
MHTPAQRDVVKERLSRYREIKIMVTGRKSGSVISIPIWLVLEGGTLYLLPAYGSDTQWYKNVLKNRSMRIEARGAEAEFTATPVDDPTQVSCVIEKFRAKYGDNGVKLCAKLDVAVLAQSR